MNQQEPQTLEEWKAAYWIIYDESNRLRAEVAYLRKFAKDMGGMPGTTLDVEEEPEDSEWNKEVWKETGGPC